MKNVILTDKSIYEMQAEVCKTLTNPKRIEILNTLQNEEKTVTELVNALGVSKANVSQHLGMLYRGGILGRRRAGTQVFYRIVSERVLLLCDTVCREQADAKKRSKRASRVQ